MFDVCGEGGNYVTCQIKSHFQRGLGLCAKIESRKKKSRHSKQGIKKSIRKKGRRGRILGRGPQQHAHTDADLGALETWLATELDATAPEEAPALPANATKYTTTRTTGIPTPSPTPRPMAKEEEAEEEGLVPPAVVPTVVVPPLEVVEDAAPQFPAQGLQVASVVTAWL